MFGPKENSAFYAAGIDCTVYTVSYKQGVSAVLMPSKKFSRGFTIHSVLVSSLKLLLQAMQCQSWHGSVIYHYTKALVNIAPCRHSTMGGGGGGGRRTGGGGSGGGGVGG
jgi:hypothetical protein